MQTTALFKTLYNHILFITDQFYCASSNIKYWVLRWILTDDHAHTHAHAHTHTRLSLTKMPGTWSGSASWTEGGGEAEVEGDRGRLERTLVPVWRRKPLPGNSSTRTQAPAVRTGEQHYRHVNHLNVQSPTHITLHILRRPPLCSARNHNMKNELAVRSFWAIVWTQCLSNISLSLP